MLTGSLLAAIFGDDLSAAEAMPLSHIIEVRSTSIWVVGMHACIHATRDEASDFRFCIPLFLPFPFSIPFFFPSFLPSFFALLLLKIATPMNFVVPTACMLATGRYTAVTARAALSGTARLRDLIRGAVLGESM